MRLSLVIGRTLPILLLAFSCSSTQHVVDRPPKTSIQIGEIKPNKVSSRLDIYRSPDLKSYIPLKQVITIVQGNGISVMFSDESFFDCVKRLLNKEFVLNGVASQYYDQSVDNLAWTSSSKDDLTSQHSMTVELTPTETQSDLIKKYVSSGVIVITIKSVSDDKTVWSCRISLEETITPTGARMAAMTGTFVDAFEKLGKQLKADGLFPERKMIKVF